MRDNSSMEMDTYKDVGRRASLSPRQRPGLRGIWLLVLLAWVVLAVVGAMAVHGEFRQEVDQRADRLLESVDYSLESRQAELARIARILAKDHRVRELMSQAKAMVALEGGGGGGDGAQALRRELAEAITPISIELIHGQDRVLQFHLGAESISFLRVHAPEHFGDKLADVRPLLGQVFRQGRGAVGFEVGRVFSGFRAVEPIWAPDRSGVSRVIGTVEVGTGVAPIDAYLQESLDARAALLLPASLAESNIWDEMRRERDIAPVGDGSFYLDGPAVDHPGLSAALEEVRPGQQDRWRLKVNGEQWLAVVRSVPIVEASNGRAARLLAVESVQGVYASMQQRLVTLLLAVLLAFLLTVGALWLLSRWQGTRWMVVVDQAKTERDALFQLSPQPVELTDAAGRTLQVNEAFRQGFGGAAVLNGSESPGETGWSGRGLEGLQLEAFQRAVSRGERWNGALRLPSPLGEMGWFRVQVVPIRDESGQTYRLWWFFQDVERERRAVAVAQAERDRLDDLLSASPAVIYTFPADRPDHVEYVSANIREILGYTPDELLDGPDWWAQTLHPDDRERAIREGDFNHWADDRKQSRYRLMRPDGTSLWVTDSARLLRDAEGRPERVVGALIDAQETVALERRLAESERLHRTIVEGVEEAIFLVRVGPQGAFRFLANNPAHARATGLSAEAFVGRAPADILPSDLAGQVQAHYRRCLEQGRTIRYTETLDLPAGRRTWRTTLTPLRDEEGRFVLIVGIGVDLGEASGEV